MMGNLQEERDIYENNVNDSESNERQVEDIKEAIKQNIESLEDVLKEVVPEQTSKEIIHEVAFSRRPVPRMWPINSDGNFDKEMVLRFLESALRFHTRDGSNTWEDIEEKTHLTLQTLEDNINRLPKEDRSKVLVSVLDELKEKEKEKANSQKEQKEAQVQEKDTAKELGEVMRKTKAKVKSNAKPKDVDKEDANSDKFNTTPKTTQKPQQTTNQPSSQTTSQSTQGDPVERFARLLIAKERITGRGREILWEENGVKREFSLYVENLAVIKYRGNRDAAFREALLQVADRMKEIRKPEGTWIYRASRKLRTWPGSIALLAIGGAGVALLPVSTAVGIGFVSLYAVGRFISSYAAISSSLVMAHRAISYFSPFRADRGLGAAVLYGSEHGINRHLNRLTSKVSVDVDSAVDSLAGYARRYRSIKIARHIASAVGALAITAVALPKGFFADVKNAVMGLFGQTPEVFVAGKGDGMWHLAERALNYHYGESFASLGAKQKNILIDALKDKMVADPGAFGLNSSELIPRAVENGGPWLKLGASAEHLADKGLVEDALGKYAAFLKGKVPATAPVREVANVATRVASYLPYRGA